MLEILDEHSPDDLQVRRPQNGLATVKVADVYAVLPHELSIVPGESLGEKQRL